MEVIYTERKCFYCAQPLPKLPSAGGLKICRACNAAREKDAVRAMSLVSRATKAGSIPSALGKLCVDCGAPAYGYDHRDYSKPLDVEPVCRSCNRRRGPAHWAPQEAA